MTTPFHKHVGDAKALPLGIALRRAAGRGAHHRQVASGVRRVPKAALEQRERDMRLDIGKSVVKLSIMVRRQILTSEGLLALRKW